MSGPYGTPMALGREPFTAFFWAIFAPVLFLTGSALLASFFYPPFEPGTAAEIQAHQLSWVFACLGMLAWFAAMSFWSDAIGASPFAGRMHADGRWLVIGVIAGPILLIVPSLLISSFMSEDGWQYRGEVNTEIFAPQNWSLAYIFMAVVLAPIVEEVTFRGVAFGAVIAKGWGPGAAIFLSSAAFALSHLQYSPAAMFVVFLTGIGFAVLRMLSGTLIVPIVAHMAANADVLILNWMAASPAT